MNKLFTKIAALALGATMAVGVGVAVSSASKEASPASATETDIYISDIATANSWVNETAYTSWNINSDVSISTAGTGNNGKYYSSNNSWRLYENGNGKLTIAGVSGVTLTDITFTYSKSNNGVLLDSSGTQKTSGTKVTLSGQSYQFNGVTHSSGTKSGNIQITRIVLNYTKSGPSPTTYTVTYNKNDSGASGTMTDTNSPYSAGATVTVLSNSFTAPTGYVFDHWDTKSDDSGTDYDPNETFTINANTTLYAQWALAPSGDSVSWDLTTTSYDADPTEDEISWSSSYVNMIWTKGTGTSVINYIPPSHDQSRCYNGNIVTISSEDGYAITKVVITGDSSNLGGLNGAWNYGDSDTISPTKDGGTLTIDLDPDSTASISRSVSGTCRVYSVEVFYVEVEIAVPTYAKVEFNSGFGTYYKGSSTQSKYTFSTTHVTVKTYDSSDAVVKTYSTGTGYKLTVNNETLDATSTSQTKSFNDAALGNYTILVVVEGVGEGGTNVNNNSQTPVCSLTLVAKDTTALAWNNEQTGTFVSYANALHIDGTFTPTWNDGGNTYSYPITTEVYTGSSAVENNKIYSDSKAYATHTAGFDITAANVPGKSLSVDTEGRLNYSSATTFYIQMYYTDYAGAKIGKVVDVVLPTLYAEDANAFNYYVGSTYQTAANVSLKYNNQVVRTLTDEFTLNPSSVTPVNTNNITVNVTFTENTNITTSYSITPREPATLEFLELYDNSGDSMTDGESFVMFTAGENFHLFNKSGQTYFAYALDSEFNEIYISSYADLSFELLDSSSATSGSGSPITTSTYMRKNMDTKWIRATYSQGTSSVSFTYQLDIENATIDDYSEGSLENYYQKVTSLDELSDSSDCIIAITISDATYAFDGRDAQNGFTAVDVDANDRITYSTDMAKLACVVTEVTDGYAIQVSATSTSNAEKYISGTSGSNALNFTTDPVTLEIEATSGRTAVGGSWDIWSHGNKFSFNGNTNNFRYRFYRSNSYNTAGYYAVDFFKRAGSSGTGNKITYLKQVIDAFRLNADLDAGSEGLSICSADSGIYSSDYWKGTNNKISVKTLYQNLTAVELLEIQVQDKFGEVGKTYADTYAMLVAKETPANNLLLKTIFGQSDSIVGIVVITSVVSLTAIGGYFFLRKRKENI